MLESGTARERIDVLITHPVHHSKEARILLFAGKSAKNHQFPLLLRHVVPCCATRLCDHNDGILVLGIGRDQSIVKSMKCRMELFCPLPPTKILICRALCDEAITAYVTSNPRAIALYVKPFYFCIC